MKSAHSKRNSRPRRIRSSARDQTGVALITALFVVSLAVIAGVAMFEATNLAIHRAQNLDETEAASWYAQGAESWTVALLQEDAKTHPVDSLADVWAQPVPYLPIERGALHAHIEDLQGRFNLNNLGNLNPQPYIDQFQRLVENVSGGQNQSGIAIANAIRDWLDADSIPAPVGGAEDDYYLGLTPAYRTAGRLMISPSELLLVKGVTPDLYNALRPFITALPMTSAKVNLNTAATPVLTSLVAAGTKFDAGFIQSRMQAPLKSVQDAVSEGVFPKGADLSLADVSSQFFLLDAEISVGNGRMEMYSLIYRPRGADSRVLMHTFGAE